MTIKKGILIFLRITCVVDALLNNGDLLVVITQSYATYLHSFIYITNASWVKI